MKTQQPPAPSNVSVRQLAATLSKTAPAPGAQPEAGNEPGAAAPTEPKEEPESPEPPEEPTDPESLTAEESQAPEGEDAPDARTAEPGAAEGDAEPEVATEEPPVKAELPPEVLEAIEIAKAQDGGKGKAEMLKRINKIVDQRDTERNARLAAEEREKGLRTELQQAREGQPATAAPIGVHPEVHKVQQELATVDHWMGWCEDNLPKLQSGEVETVEAPDGKGGKIRVGAKEVAKTLRDLQDIRQEVVARKVSTEKEVKVAFDQAYQESHKAALTKFPQFAKADSEWSIKKNQILQAMPGMKSFPDHEIMIGHFLRGLDLDAAAAKKPAPVTRKAPPAREPTRVPVEAPAGSVEQGDEGEEKVKKSSQQFVKTGSVRDLARTLTASRQASRTVKR